MPWTAAGAGEAAAAVEARTTGTLGSASAAAAEELGPAASMAPRVEVPVRGVGPWPPVV